MRFVPWIKRRLRRLDKEERRMRVDGGTRIAHDADAPKEIVSRTLVRFSCRFSSVSLIEEETSLQCGLYHFCAERNEDGKDCSVSCERVFSVCDQRLQAVRPISFMDEIEALLRTHNVARFNGKYYFVSGLPSFFGASVDAVFESGETVCCSNNQDPFLPSSLIKELCCLFELDSENKD